MNCKRKKKHIFFKSLDLFLKTFLCLRGWWATAGVGLVGLSQRLLNQTLRLRHRRVRAVELHLERVAIEVDLRTGATHDLLDVAAAAADDEALLAVLEGHEVDLATLRNDDLLELVDGGVELLEVVAGQLHLRAGYVEVDAVQVLHEAVLGLAEVREEHRRENNGAHVGGELEHLRLDGRLRVAAGVALAADHNAALDAVQGDGVDARLHAHLVEDVLREHGEGGGVDGDAHLLLLGVVLDHALGDLDGLVAAADRHRGAAQRDGGLRALLNVADGGAALADDRGDHLGVQCHAQRVALDGGDALLDLRLARLDGILATLDLDNARVLRDADVAHAELVLQGLDVRALAPEDHAVHVGGVLELRAESVAQHLLHHLLGGGDGLLRPRERHDALLRVHVHTGAALRLDAVDDAAAGTNDIARHLGVERERRLLAVGLGALQQTGDSLARGLRVLEATTDEQNALRICVDVHTEVRLQLAHRRAARADELARECGVERDLLLGDLLLHLLELGADPVPLVVELRQLLRGGVVLLREALALLLQLVHGLVDGPDLLADLAVHVLLARALAVVEVVRQLLPLLAELHHRGVVLVDRGLLRHEVRLVGEQRLLELVVLEHVLLGLRHGLALFLQGRDEVVLGRLLRLLDLGVELHERLLRLRHGRELQSALHAGAVGRAGLDGALELGDVFIQTARAVAQRAEFKGD
eukprot:PhM_4_TR9209/c0_g1_i1/m.17309